MAWSRKRQFLNGNSFAKKKAFLQFEWSGYRRDFFTDVDVMVQYMKNTPKRFYTILTFVGLVVCIAIQLIDIRHIELIPKVMSRSMLQRTEPDIDFWVKRYLDWHDKNRHTATRGAIFLPVPAGLGDNIKGMINLWGYAVLTNRLLLLDVTKPYPLKEVLSERAVRRFVFNPELDKRFARYRIGHKIRIGVKVHLLDRVKKMLRANHPTVALRISISDRPDTIAKDLGFVNSQIPPFSYQVRRAIAQILLEPSDEVKALIQSYKTKWKLDDNMPYLAVHARLGGVGEQNIERFIRMRGKYKKIAQCLASRILVIAKNKNMTTPVHVFVATDTLEFRTFFKSSVEEKSPTSMVHLMENDVHHFTDALRKSAHINLHAENLLLGGANHILSFRSGFSQVAALRGNADMSVIPYYACEV